MILDSAQSDLTWPYFYQLHSSLFSELFKWHFTILLQCRVTANNVEAPRSFVLGPKLLLVMGCVKLGQKNCVQLPSVGEQNAN